MAATRGPQVVLEGYARTVARGGGGRTMRENVQAMDQLVSAGMVSDGNSVDGSSKTGGQPYDAVVARFPDEPLPGWEPPAPLLGLQNMVLQVGETLTVDGSVTFNGPVSGVGGGNFVPLDGSKPMTGALQLPDGTLAAPSLALGAVDGTGLSRSGASLSIGVQGTITLGLFAGTAQFYGPLSLLNNKIIQLSDATAATDALNLRTADARYIPALGVTPLAQNDINPRIHLPRFATTGPKKVCIIGDSTSTDAVASNYTEDPTQTIWGALKSEITRRNPQNKHMFVNRGIPGANWAHPMMSATDSGTTQAPPWYTDPNKIWLDYVRDDMPDTLFVLLGTNSPSSGLTAGASVASYINDFFIRINAWVKVPDVIIITNKIANPDAGGSYLADQESYKAMASFLRTFARSDSNGYTAFPRIGYIGLLDLGRHYAARALGKDLAYQYMSKVPSAIRSGLTLVGPYPGTVTTLGSTTDGDLRLTLVFRNAGGTAMFAACGSGGFFLTCSAFVANRIHVTLTAGGIWTARYQLLGTDAAPVVTGANYSPPSGDVSMTVTLKSEVLQISLNGVLVIDTQVARLISNYTAAIGAGINPTGTITFDVTEFSEGIGAPTLRTIDPTNAFGQAGGPQAGNDINHPSSSTVAQLDYQVIAATNWAAPQPTAQQLKDDKVQIYMDATSSPNTAITTEEIIKQTQLQSNLLINVGDMLEVEAWGNLTGSTDVKTARIRWGGLTGAAMSAPAGSVASATRWHARATVTKTGSNTQVYGGDGTVAASGNTGGTSGGTAALPDTQPITLCITSQNATTATAGSITCECFRVALIKAPGT